MELPRALSVGLHDFIIVRLFFLLWYFGSQVLYLFL